MSLYSKESLDLLRDRIDLMEVVSSYVPMQRAGASYKACCPFHDEKSPSFVIQKGDTHYHCFGCGAHGDAIAFLMGYLKMSFVEAIESLAERFQVALERVEQQDSQKGPSKLQLKVALEKACGYYQFFLLHTEEGHQALDYLYARGIDLTFIRKFQIGYALKQSDSISQLLRNQGMTEEILIEAGLISISQSGRKRDFFQERITFPIRDALGAVIGFSARKFKEDTFGGKYINTSETPLFKKSHVLFGLSYSRQMIAKERKALIVEGQIDALRLIHAGFPYAVAGQGTAFGEGHVKELVSLGVNHVFLALDADKAGKEASVKIGDLFQQRGIEVSVVQMTEGNDPDTFLKDKGPEAFQRLLDQAKEYLLFVYEYWLGSGSVSPAKKNEVVESLVSRIKKWDHPVHVHESLRKLATIAGIPEATIGMGMQIADSLVPRPQALTKWSIDPNKILETDVLRWILLDGEHQTKWIQLAKLNLAPSQFKCIPCKLIYEAILQVFEQGLSIDFYRIGSLISSPEEHQILSDIMDRKINLQKAKEGVIESVRKVLLKNWMEEREQVKTQIQNSSLSEENVLVLAKKFDDLKKNIPQVIEL